MALSEQPKMRAERLPWAATAAALLAFVALALTGGVTLALPLLSVGLLATYVFEARIGPEQWWLHWLLRLALYSLVAALNAAKPDEGLTDSLVLAPAMDTLGQMMAAELVIQAWRRQPSRPPAVISLILLSGLTMVAACQTMDVHYPRLFVPPYMLCVLLALQSRAGLSWGRAAAILVAIWLGAGSYVVIWTNRAGLSDWATRVIEGRSAPESTGLSDAPSLGSTFGLRGSAVRVLRIIGLHQVTYLRGDTFETYNGGQWLPAEDNRPYTAANLRGNANGLRAQVTTMASTSGLLVAPLNVAGVDVETNGAVEWSADYDGPLRVLALQPEPYDLILSAGPGPPGPLEAPPSTDEVARCLQVSQETDPRVRALAQRIAVGIADPHAKIQAVTGYLMTHHRYSLSYNHGPGDPVSDFLLQSPPAAAHCEYFAASAVILLRCLHIPARYVVGYYAHEFDGDHILSVRQRDAHAWAEAWVPGTGWQTVDATPPDGRPEGVDDSVPWWQRLTEWFSDHLLTGHLSFSREDLLRLLPGIVGLCLLAGAIYALRRKRLQPDTDAAHDDYAPADATMVQLAQQFEALLARFGIPCPPWRPWAEHLNTLAEMPSAAHRFVAAYSQARFGGVSESAPQELKTLLAEAENALRDDAEKETE